MRKQLLLALSLLIASAGFSQKGFHLGVSGTFSSTWILNQNNYGTMSAFTDSLVKKSELDYKPTWGWNAGLVMGYNFTKHLGFQLEFQYNFTGQRYEDNFGGPAIIPQDTFSGFDRVNVKRNIKLQYLQIPLMFKYTSGGKIVKFFGCLGPQLGFRTAASEEVKIAGYNYVSNEANYSSKEKFQGFDVGVALQLGAAIFVGKHLYFDAGLSTYVSILDLNGKKLKDLEWYSKNDVKYQKSHNFRVGLMAGAHWIFGKKKKTL